eukprot:gnl/MRDRNA2_/MRDRNA2_18298_c0_seq1.p1 gnl/MRDRNA2_/MRDRNA2_18298_c0~~gnl/MRDRNA2_/MRDRNA2_18298_c0_seq1.p1  ORF type:complete len:394 (+),score=49.89 gnl/MRDRNA2_/MRDRNA2_18298_c0_seq1:82-1263(+)
MVGDEVLLEPAGRKHNNESCSSSAEHALLLEPGCHNDACYFCGCGFLLPFHFGVALCLRDNDITFSVATGQSGGVMAALVVLNAADLEVGIRQCFDLRQEKATNITSISAFRATYRQYFKCFRNKEFRALTAIRSLQKRLRVSVSLLQSGKASIAESRPETTWWWQHFFPLKECAVSDWKDETQLADAFMAAAYIPGGTALLPARLCGHIACDGMIPEALGFGDDRKGFDVRWPCEEDQQKANSIHSRSEKSQSSSSRTRRTSGIRLLSVPFREGPYRSKLDHHSEGTVIVQGSFHTLWHFWASPAVMHRSFVEGYIECQKAITLSRKPLTASEVEVLLGEIMERQRSWKETTSFIPPKLFLERDSIMFRVLPFVCLLAAVLMSCLQVLEAWV